MQRIEAIVRPDKVDAVQEALAECGVRGMTVDAVQGFGRQRGRPDRSWREGDPVAFVPMMKITLVVEDADAPRLTAAIRDAAHTGGIGDGKIFVASLGEAVRIRTGESGDSAL